eukprot:TRINITY_DN12208_c0_g2_i1.p1 TRINITY_DN12208_c0_g2~~TRINITY_DN12208_c0_g2_i1.p1  ORF type:complete len:694 (-),score=48.68 TRINITY_DN12208_c0_g2_i1:472-2553(-)
MSWTKNEDYPVNQQQQQQDQEMILRKTGKFQLKQDGVRWYVGVCRVILWFLIIAVIAQFCLSVVLLQRYLQGPLQSIAPHPTLDQIYKDFSKFRVRKQLRENSRQIPRFLHQTQSKAHLKGISPEYARSWVKYGKFADIGFYNDNDIKVFVQEEYPEFVNSFMQLRNADERQVVFKFLIVYHYGGVYADPESECINSFDKIIESTDSMVVGWYGEAPSHGKAHKMGLVRQRQLASYVFAAVPGHPVLKEMVQILLQKSDNRQTLSMWARKTNRWEVTQHFNLQRESEGLFTDLVLQHIQQHPANVTSNPWTISVLPIVAFGSSSQTNIKTTMTGVVTVLNKRRSSFTSDHVPEVHKSADHLHYPVTILQNPAFTQMTNLVRQDTNQSHFDVSEQITKYGNFQWGIHYDARPTVWQIFLGFLGIASDNPKMVFVDIGAGIGFTSLAAAARGHHVIAFEASKNSINTFVHSIEYNGFQSLINVVQKPVRKEHGESVCVQRSGEYFYTDQELHDLMHGYGNPGIHALPKSQCQKTMEAVRVDNVLDLEDAELVIGAIKITANGWEGHILESMDNIFKYKAPKAVFITYSPQLLTDAGYESPKNILEYMNAFGYDLIAFSGQVCQDRLWAEMKQQQLDLELEQDLSQQTQGTWCWLNQQEFDDFDLRTNIDDSILNNVLFIRGNGSDFRQDQDFWQG